MVSIVHLKLHMWINVDLQSIYSSGYIDQCRMKKWFLVKNLKVKTCKSNLQSGGKRNMKFSKQKIDGEEYMDKTVGLP